MNSKSIRYLGIFIACLTLITTFQNCGQGGALTESGQSLSKTDSPLVADVVSEIQTQNPPQPEVVPDKTPTQPQANQQQEHIDYIKHESEDDIVFDNELENVLKNHSCSDHSSKKVLICHYPKGKPENRHELCIGRAALRAHLSQKPGSAHLDHLGKCPNKVEP